MPDGETVSECVRAAGEHEGAVDFPTLIKPPGIADCRLDWDGGLGQGIGTGCSLKTDVRKAEKVKF